jgi:hypothetical protein
MLPVGRIALGVQGEALEMEPLKRPIVDPAPAS